MTGNSSYATWSWKSHEKADEKLRNKKPDLARRYIIFETANISLPTLLSSTFIIFWRKNIFPEVPENFNESVKQSCKRFEFSFYGFAWFIKKIWSQFCTQASKIFVDSRRKFTNNSHWCTKWCNGHKSLIHFISVANPIQGLILLPTKSWLVI